MKIIDDNFNLHACAVPGINEKMQVKRSAGLSFVDSGLSCDTFNIIHITDGTILTGQDFFEAVNHFRNRQFSFCIWVNDENLTPAVKEFFIKGNLVQQNTEPGMVLDLTKYDPVQEPNTHNIVIADSIPAIKDFAEVVASNWTPPDDNVRKYFSNTAGNYLSLSDKISLVIYYDGDKPVSVIEMFGTGGETIGLYSLATLADYRGKGIGSTLLKFALKKAKESGYKKAILQASEDGIGIYKKYGFAAETLFYEFS